MDWLDYREKLKIGFNDRNKEQYFFTRIFNVLNTVAMDMPCKAYLDFFDTTGTAINSNLLTVQHGVLRYSECKNILAKHTSSLSEFLAYYMAFVNSLPSATVDRLTLNNEFFLGLVEKILTSTHIPFEILNDDDGCFIFPKGAEEMDLALVSEPLAWLCNYPNAHTAFVKALKEYSEASSENASEIADKFRKALETFLREFFTNNAPLEKNKDTYGKYLKDQGVPSELRNNMETLIQAYANFMNGYAKHQDKTSINVLEYLMYQTGNIVRLLITLKNRENVD